MRQVSVEIRGLAGSGKTTIAKIFSEALEKHGINCRLVDCDESPEIQPQRIEALKKNGVDINVDVCQSRRIVDLTFSEIPLAEGGVCSLSTVGLKAITV